MAGAKDCVVKVIPASVANPFVRAHHYSGKVVSNSQLHLGVFYQGGLHGVMSFGPSMDKRKVQGLVRNTGWNGFIELNRMAFDDVLPKNSESRCIAQAVRMIRKNAPHIRWIVSFADGAQAMADLEGDLQRAVESFEELQRALLKAEASASKDQREVMASALFAMRYTATLMGR